MILLDTCALLWLAFEPEVLSPLAQTTLQTNSELAISSISIWEIGIKVKKGKLQIPLSLSAFVKLLKKTAGFQIIPVEDQHWMASLELDWNHPDPADRVIVATAQLNNLPLITEDHAIRSFYHQTVW